MNDFWKAMLGGIVRTAAATAGGYAVAKGTVSADTVTQLTGAVSVAGAGIWSLIQKYRTQKTA